MTNAEISELCRSIKLLREQEEKGGVTALLEARIQELWGKYTGD